MIRILAGKIKVIYHYLLHRNVLWHTKLHIYSNTYGIMVICTWNKSTFYYNIYNYTRSVAAVCQFPVAYILTRILGEFN